MQQLRFIQVNFNGSWPAHAMVDDINKKMVFQPETGLTGSQMIDIVINRSLCSTQQGKGFACIDIAYTGRTHSCCIGSNCTIEVFQVYMHDLTVSIRDALTRDRIVLAGTFDVVPLCAVSLVPTGRGNF